MKKGVIKKFSVILNIILLSGILFFFYRYYPTIKSKFFPENLTAIQEAKLKDQNDIATDFYDASNFKIIGQLPNTKNYERLPLSSKNKVRKPVWGLSKNSAGISIRFSSNSSIIKIRWKLKDNRNPSNMTPITAKGLDLYAFNDNDWKFVGVAKPNGTNKNEALVIQGMETINREYLLNLPLYDGIDLLEIGIDKNARISNPKKEIIDTFRPIIFYGTSITQGASASRPGLTYSALIKRRLNKDVINLGFSGNGWFEKEIIEYAMTSNPSLIILDCTPNSSADVIRKNLPKTINYINSIDNKTPIVLIESVIRDFAFFKKDDKSIFGTKSFIKEQNKALKETYDNISKTNKNVFYIRSENLIGKDNEATIDGTHFNDLGHYRAYELIKEEIEKITLYSGIWLNKIGCRSLLLNEQNLIFS